MFGLSFLVSWYPVGHLPGRRRAGTQLAKCGFEHFKINNMLIITNITKSDARPLVKILPPTICANAWTKSDFYLGLVTTDLLIWTIWSKCLFLSVKSGHYSYDSDSSLVPPNLTDATECTSKFGRTQLYYNSTVPYCTFGKKTAISRLTDDDERGVRLNHCGLRSDSTEIWFTDEPYNHVDLHVLINLQLYMIVL